MAGKPTYEELERKVKELEKEIVDRKATEETFQKSLEKYHAVFQTTKDAIFVSDETGKFIDINQAACESLGYSKEELLQLSNKEIDANEKGYEAFLKVRNGLAKNMTFEVNQRRKDGTLLPVEITGNFFNCKGERLAVAIVRNITERKLAKEMLQKAYDKLERRVKERTAELSKANAELKQEISEHKQAEETLKEKEEELSIKTNSLEEVNTALKVLLKRRDEDKTELEENLLSNVKELVVPFLLKVKNSQLNPKQLSYINIVESNLNEIISPFLRNLSSKWLNLTPTEIRVAHLIKEGKTTKEIGEMMALSPRTIETHRKNIRKKLGIEKNKGNLRSHLLTLQ